MNNKFVKLMVVIMVSLILVVGFSGCATEEQATFLRGVNFGMTREEVVAVEMENDAEKKYETIFEDESYSYKEIQLFNIGGDLVYSFDSNNNLKVITLYGYEEFKNDEVVASLIDALNLEYDIDLPIISDGKLHSTYTSETVEVKLDYESSKVLVLSFTQSM